MALIVFNNSADLSLVSQATFFSFNSSSPDHYNWNSSITSLPGAFVLTALSGEGDIVTSASNVPLAGTVNGILASSDDGQAYTITELSVALTALFDLSSPVAGHSAYWETILAGVTRFSNSATGSFTMTGDFITVAAAESRIGAADSFNLSGIQSSRIFGDAFTVLSGGLLTGGRDTINIAGTQFTKLIVSGDVDSHAGVVTGGADAINLSIGIAADSIISGDAITSDGTLTGGADKITLNLVSTFASPDYIVAGDAIDALRQVKGGNDIITITAGPEASPPVIAIALSGDVNIAATVNSFVTGGNDRITITNASTGSVAGDVFEQSAGTTIAGNDTITVNSPLGTTIAGDILFFTGGTLTPGADIIRGGPGNDTIFGESSTPGFPALAGTVVNAGGNDFIDGREGNDSLLGQVGNDRLAGGLGNDLINGGSGIDTALFNTVAQGVYVDLNGIAGLSGQDGLGEAFGQGIDDFISIENVTGSNQADTIKGDSTANVLTGLDGNDILTGRGGADTLIGGRGQDRLNGGLGNDIFDFNAVNELSAIAIQTDIIIGFATGDKIDISAIPTGAGAAFAFQTTPLSGAGQVTFSVSNGDVIISGSTDTDAAAEFTILVKGITSIAAADFIL